MPRASRKLSAKARAARNKAAREWYHAHKAGIVSGTKSAPPRGQPVHLQAAAKRVVAAINLQLRDDPSLTDLIITAHVLAKAVLS